MINTSNAANRPIAWLILSERVPTRAEKDEFVAQNPSLKVILDKAYDTKNEGLTMHRLKELAGTEPRIKAWMPQERDVTTLRKFAEDFIESTLERVEGISNANVLGGREEELQVVVNPEHLAARGLTINDIRIALRSQNQDTSGGDYWEGKRRYVVRTLGHFRSLEQVENAIVARRDGVPVYVRNIAEVVEGYKKPDGIVKRFGTTSIAINVQRGLGENVLDVMKGVRTATKELNEDVLRNNELQLIQVYDETDYIYSAMSLVTDNLFWGSIFTFVTLLVFLRSGWSTVIIFAHIIISTVGAFLVMAALGRSLNVPALGGLAFAVGMLVDNAIVMLENIFRRHQRGEDPETAAVIGAGEVWGALLNATLANLAVFIPVLFIREEAGQLFRDIAIAISAAVALSMLVAIAVVPTAAMRILKKHKRDHDGNVITIEANPNPQRRFGLLGILDLLTLPIRLILKVADRVAEWMVALLIGVNRTLQIGLLPRIIVVCGVVVVSCVFTWMLLPKVEYLPSGDRNLVFGIIIPPPGYNLDHLLKMGDLVEEELRPYWDVESTDPDVISGKKLVIDDFFFVARNRQVFVGARALDPTRAKDLVGVIQKVGDKLPGSSDFWTIKRLPRCVRPDAICTNSADAQLRYGESGNENLSKV